MATKQSPYADLIEPLKSYLPQMYDSYPKLDELYPSSWFMWQGKDVIHFNKQVCHAQMRHANPGLENLVTAVPNKTELGLEYLRMLIRGPFRSLSDLIRLDRAGPEYYLHCMSLDKWPANVLFNFCIASRIPIEFEYLLPTWAKRCDEGFNPALAFLLVCSFGTKLDKTQFKERCFHWHRSGHMWFDPSSSWHNILNGIIENPSLSYSVLPYKATPTNIIWGKSKDYTKLMDMTDEEIAAFYTQPIEVYEAPKPPAPKTKFNPYKIPNPMLEIPIEAVQAPGGFAQWAFQLANPLPAAQAEPQPEAIHAAEPGPFDDWGDPIDFDD